jgi:hypothetical protein
VEKSGEQLENSKVRQRKAQTGLLEVIQLFKTTDNFRLKPMVSFFYTANINKNNLHSQCIGSSELQKGLEKT